MVNTVNKNLKDSKEDILQAIETIVNPIAKTMSPRGANVLFRAEDGTVVASNDGATIARYIKPKNELQRMVVDAIVDSSQQTNQEAGDATSTTILLTGNIIKLFIEESETVSHFDFINALESVRDFFITELDKIRIGGNGIEISEDELKKVAFVSANNNKEIADLSVDVVMKAGDYGIINLDVHSHEASVEFKKGFIIPRAVPSPLFLNKNTGLEYDSMSVFITDGTIFFQEDLNTIIDAAAGSGNKNIMIVAKKFQGKIPELIQKVHQDTNRVSVLPIELEDVNIIGDLAHYLNTKLFSSNLGRPDEATIDDYIGSTDGVEGNIQLLVIQRDLESDKRKQRIEFLKSIYKKESTDDIKKRLSSMTSGVVTLTVGGHTDIERTERKMRFEDAILATQKAIVHGYLPGGGTALAHIQSLFQSEDGLEQTIAAEIGLSSVLQIENNNNFEGTIIETEGFYGLNSLTGEVEDLKEAGIYDSYKAVEQSLLNSVSTSIQLISAMSNTIITNTINE